MLPECKFLSARLQALCGSVIQMESIEVQFLYPFHGLKFSQLRARLLDDDFKEVPRIRHPWMCLISEFFLRIFILPFARR